MAESQSETANLQRLILISHPPAKEIGGQIDLMEEDDDRYGEYVGAPEDATVEGDHPEDKSELMQKIEVAPRTLERLASVGAFVVEGWTRDNIAAKVIVDPSSKKGKGEILLG